MQTLLALVLLSQTHVAKEGAPLLGTKAPPFTTIDWITPPPVTEGKVVLVRFWLGDCPYCKGSAEALSSLHREFGDRGLVVVGIHHPKSEEAKSLEFVKRWTKMLGFEFAVGQDLDWSTVKAFGVGSVFQSYTSVSVLYDQSGTIRWVHDGGTLDGAAHQSARAIIAKLLESEAKQVAIRIKGWSCGSCAERTRAALSQIAGVRQVDVDFEKKRVLVTYDPAQASESKLIGAVTRLGYSAEAHP